MTRPKLQNMYQWISLKGIDCNITIEPKQHYCDRGNYLAKIFPDMGSKLYVDGQDGWPRYYFDLERACLECEDWLKKRKQYINDNWELETLRL